MHTPDVDRLSTVTARLAAAGCVAAAEEATELLSDRPDDAVLEARLARRERGEPLAWIVGQITFAGHRLAVSDGVYVPRPHTEDLVRRASATLPAGGRVVDLCTGTGAVAAVLGAIGVDIDPVAVACARSNGVPVVRADLAEVPLADRCADVVTAVPPYVPASALALLPADVQTYEPRAALDGGADGLTRVRQVVATASRLLRPGGRLFVELGADQDRLIAPDLARAGFAVDEAWYDAEGDLRGVAAALIA